MEIKVAKGESRVLSFTVTPELPKSDLAQEWKLVCDEENPGVHVTDLDVIFSKSSSPSERLLETLTLNIAINKSAQTNGALWHFTGPGLIYATNAGDYKACISSSIKADGIVLEMTFRCLDIDGESFKFSFLAMHTDLQSGACTTYASADPGGSVGRRD